MKKVKQTVLFIAVICLASCSNVLDKKVDIKTGKEDISKIKEQYKDKYTAEELNYLSDEAAKYFIAGALGQGKGVEKTYGELLQDIHTKKIKYDSTMTEYTAVVKKVKSAIALTVTNSGMSKGVYNIGDFLSLAVSIKNNSGKSIAAYEGVITVQSLTDSELGRFKYTSSKTLGAGQEIQEKNEWSVFNNVYELEQTAHDKLKFMWEPRVVVFEDGEKLTTPTKPSNPLGDPFKD